MIKLYAAASIIELEPVRLALEAAEIPCYLQNQFPPAAGEVPPVVAWPTLYLLDESRLQEAQAIVEESRLK